MARHFDLFGHQILESRVGNVAVKDAFCETSLLRIVIIKSAWQGPTGDGNNATIAFEIGTKNVHRAGSREFYFLGFARGEVVFHDAADDSGRINDKKVVLALGNVLDRIRRLRNDRLGVCPIRVFHFGANHLVFWRAGMRHGIGVFAGERQTANQVVRGFAQRLPVDLFRLQLGTWGVENAEFSLHRADETDDVIRIGFINGSARKLLGSDAQLRVTFIAEEIDVTGKLRAQFVYFRFAVELDFEALDVRDLAHVIEKRFVILHPTGGAIGGVNAFRQKRAAVHIQNAQLRVFSAAGGKTHHHVFAVPGRGDAFDGGHDAGFVGVWIEVQFLGPIPAFAEEKLADVFAAQG